MRFFSLMTETVPTLNAYLALVVVLINFVYAILTLARTSRTNTYILFALICVSNIFWNLGDFMIYLTGNRAWYYFSRVGSSMLPALMFHFIIDLVEFRPKRLAWVRIPYVLSGLFAFMAFGAMFHPAGRSFMDGGLRNLLYIVFLAPVLLLGIGVIRKGIRRTKLKDQQARLRHILIAAVIGVFTGLTETVQFLNLPIPSLGHLGCLAYSSLLAFSVFKHRAAYDVLTQMKDRLESLGEMAAGISHEIRNPLTSIKGASDLLWGELKSLDLPRAREYHDIIREEIDRLNHILLNFQYFTRPLKIEKELIPVNEIIRKTVRLAETAPATIKIRQELSGNSPKVKVDASLLKQVFLNLIKNAEEACGPEGEIVIKTETLPPWFRISFSDNGPGISAENFDRIFEPFFTTKSAGMGMGLAICRRIMLAHGGELDAKNRLPNGAEFTILLPM
jgi:signal transduction histidine kinase